MSAARTAERIGASVIERLRADLDARLHYPPTDPARIRDPRESGAPMTLAPPVPGTRDSAAARVVARWMVEADHKFRWRGIRARFIY